MPEALRRSSVFSKVGFCSSEGMLVAPMVWVEVCRAYKWPPDSGGEHHGVGQVPHPLCGSERIQRITSGDSHPLLTFSDLN